MNLISLLQVFAGFSWLAVFGLVAYVIFRAARRQSYKGLMTALIVVAILTIALNTLAAGLVFIEPTELGVVVSAVPGQDGVRQDPLQSGLNWIVPYFDRVVTYTISRQTYTMSIAHEEGDRIGDDSVEARTSDGQVVRVDASVIYAIAPSTVVQVHIDWQSGYQENLIRTLSRGIIRDAVAIYSVEEVYGSERMNLSTQVEDELASRLADEGFVLVDFILRNIAFSDEYAASVEQKVIADQLAQQAAYVVEQRRQEAEQARQQAEGLADAAVIAAQGRADSLLIQAEAEAEARVIQAQAEAEALRLLGEALADYPDVLTLQYIEKLAEDIDVMLLPSDNPFLLPLPELEGGGTTLP